MSIDPNRKNLNKLADIIRSGTLPYGATLNMSAWFDSEDPDCGTICCIGGAAEALSLGEPDHPDESLGGGFSLQRAQRWLGLHSAEAHALFYPLQDEDPDWSTITPEQAAQALDVLAKGGTIRDLENHWKECLDV